MTCRYARQEVRIRRRSRHPTLCQALGDDQRGPYCGLVNLVHLPQELAPKAQRREDHVLLIPSQQRRGKARAQSHGGWQPTAVQGNTNLLRSETQPDPDIPTTPGEDVSENNIQSVGVKMGYPRDMLPPEP